MHVDDVCASGQAEERHPGAHVARRRPPVRLNRMELDSVAAVEPSPGLRTARARNVDREAAGREAVDEADHVARNAAVDGLCRQE